VLKDVAQLAGTSVSTVSRVLSGTGMIADETAERVRRAVRETGFVINRKRSAAARSRASRGLKHNLIALAGCGYGEGDSPAPHPLAATNEGILAAAHEAGVAVGMFRVTLADLRSQVPPASLARAEVDAILVHTTRGMDHGFIGRIAPTVLYGASPGRACSLPVVESDNTVAVEAVLSHLWGLGHRRFDFVSHYLDAPMPHYAYVRRRDAFVAGLAERGAPAGRVVALPSFDVEAYASEFCALPAHARPTAIVASNDGVALKLLAAFAARGVRVPQEVSVTGYDGYPLGQDVFPPLTTWCPNWGTLGRTAFRCVVERALGNDIPSHVLVGGRLEVRGSTGPPAG